jgi:hypothetical protein
VRGSLSASLGHFSGVTAIRTTVHGSLDGEERMHHPGSQFSPFIPLASFPSGRVTDPSDH